MRLLPIYPAFILSLTAKKLSRSYHLIGMAVLLLSACGSEESGTDGSEMSSGGSPEGASGGEDGSGGTGGGIGPSSGGSAPGGGDNTGAAASDGGGGASGGIPGSGGEGTGGDGAGGDGTGGSNSTSCTRPQLDGIIDDYLAAVAAGDPSGLPLSANLKFTENAQVATIGTTDFWMNAGEAKYSQRALDTEACSVAVQAVIPESGTDLPVGIRIKLEASEIIEVETIVVRPGDYTAAFAVDSDPTAIVDIAAEIGWHDEVPQAERATRTELISWIDKYFRLFPSGVCDVTDTCKRLENGGGNFGCDSGAMCSAGAPGPNDEVFVPRVILADEERGIAVGFTIFDYMTTGHLDMHMIKMSGGQVHAVQAILRDTNGQSGWE